MLDAIDIAEHQNTITQREATITQHAATISTLTQQRDEYYLEKLRLEVRLAKALKQAYGPRADRLNDPGQLLPDFVGLLDALHVLLIEQKAKLLPKHPLAEAIGYTLNQWRELTLFTSDPAVSIRTIRAAQTVTDQTPHRRGAVHSTDTKLVSHPRRPHRQELGGWLSDAARAACVGTGGRATSGTPRRPGAGRHRPRAARSAGDGLWPRRQLPGEACAQKSTGPRVGTRGPVQLSHLSFHPRTS